MGPAMDENEVLEVGWNNQLPKSELKKNIIGITAAEIGLQWITAVYASITTCHRNE